MKNFFGKIWTSIKSATVWVKKFVLGHKIASGVIVLALIGGGYYAYTAVASGNAANEYVLATVTRAPLQVTVTESGQVDSKDTLSVTPQGGASGQITYIGVTPGQTVAAGTLIAQLDATNASESVTSARQDLESAEISYQQTLTSSQTSNVNDQTSVSTAQTNAVADITTTYTNLPAVMQSLDTTLHSISTIPNYNVQENIDAYDTLINTAQAHTYHDEVAASDATAVASYQSALAAYTTADTANMTPAQIEQLDETTIQATQNIDQALRDTLTYLNYIQSQLNNAKTALPSQLPTAISAITSDQSTASSDEQSVTSANTSLISAEQSLTQDTQTLSGSSSVPLDVQSAQLNVAKAQESLTQAETTAADYSIRAPFSGTIATVPVNQYDEASSGTTIATLITDQEYVDLSLNEADAAKVIVGQPVSMTFDAITGLTLTGKVAAIDPVGTVTQGVVTYDVQISFDAEDPRVKPGMTVTAVITTASEASAIQVPSSAITTTNGMSYVQVATLTNASSTLAAAGNGGAGGTYGARRTRTATSTSATGGTYGAGFGNTTGGTGSSSTSTMSTTTAAFAARIGSMTRSLTVPESSVTIKRVPVTVGLSTDTMTEVTSGLTPGEYVVSSTITKASSTTKSSAASATSLLGGSTRTGAGFTGGAGGGGGTYTRSGGGAAVGAAGR